VVAIDYYWKSNLAADEDVAEKPVGEEEKDIDDGQIYDVTEKAEELHWACWHEIWPGGFGGVRGLTAPIGLRLRASGW